MTPSKSRRLYVFSLLAVAACSMNAVDASSVDDSEEAAANDSSLRWRRPRPTGGTSSTGGNSTGGTTSGGTTGGTSTGGTSTGGTSTGGTSTGGTSTGGTSTGGTSTGGTSTGGTSTGGTSTGGTSTGNSPGCGKAAPYTGHRSLTISAAGKTRSYDVYVPAGYDPSTPLALLFQFHAANGSIATDIADGMHAVPGAAAGAIIAYPQGLQFQSYGVGWDESCNGYDLAFVDAMIQTLESQFCIATGRVFVTGFSWGGDFVNALACCRGTAIRAIAANSGGEWGAEYPANVGCGSKPMPAYRFAYGTADGSYTQQQFQSVLGLYRTSAHCQATALATTPSPCVAYQGCDRPVIECKYVGMGHSRPPTWATDTWNFFSTFK